VAVTGGLGTLGKLVASWSVQQGSRRLSLLGRSGRTSDHPVRGARLNIKTHTHTHTCCALGFITCSHFTHSSLHYKPLVCSR
jgi:hypothetical protein